MVNRGKVRVHMNVVPRSTRDKDFFKIFFFASCGSLFPFTRANAQWVFHGFK